MRTPNGILHVVDFKTEQIVSVIQPKDYWDDIRHWEIKNNVDMLEFRTFDGTPHAVTLQQQNLIVKEVRDGRMVPYVINNEVEKDSDDRSITVHASGAWSQIAKDGYIMPQRIESKTVNELIDMALIGMKWKRGVTEYAGFHTITIDEIIDPLTFLKKIAALFDLEIQYRVEVVGSQITGWYVDMIKKRGRETGKEVELGKDLIGVKRIEHSRDICTALVGFVKGEGDKILTVESINNGLPYITDSDAFQRWNERGKHKFGFYTPETEDQNMTPQRLMTLMKTEFKKRVNTSVAYEVEAASIGRVFGLAHELVNEGDTIKIKDTGFTPKLYLEARVIAGDESFTDPTQDKYVFGDYREIVDSNEELRKLYNKVLASLGNKANKELLEQLEKLAEEAKKESGQAVKESQAAKEISEKLKENIEDNMVDIIEAKNQPTTGLKPNKTLWRDISNGKPGILKIWTGTAWESVVPDTGPLQKSIKDAEKDINTLKDTVKDLPDTTWLNQQLEGKADKDGTYTKDWVNNNLIGKQVYETNRKGDIEKLTETTTIAERTAKEIINKAEKTEVITLSDNLKQVTQTANTAKQTAESNTNTITSLQTTVNNISVGSINLSSGSETGLNKQNMTGTWSDSKQMTVSDKVNYRNKTFTISFLFTGKMTKINTNCWFGVETAITYADGEQEWKSIRADGKLSLNVEYKDEPLYVMFKTKDKDVTKITFYYSGRNIDGNLNSHHAKFEEGNIRTTWQAANEEITSKSDFTKTTNEIKQTLETNSQTISKVQQDQSTMQTTLNEVKQTTDSNSLNIKTLIETQTDQGKLIQENKNEITQTKDSLSSKISEKQMKAYMGALGSTNLLFNTEFKKKTVDANGNVTNEVASTDKWTIAGVVSGATVTPVTDRRHDGYNAVRIENTGVAANSWTGIAQSIGASQNSGDYVLSAWVYVVDKNLLDQGACVKLQFFNGSTALGYEQTEIKELLVNGSWILVSVTIKAPDVPVTRLQGDIWVRRNGTMWVSQPQIQQGKEPSVYMPNPKDITNYKELVDLVADKIAKSDFDTITKNMQTEIRQNTEEIGFRAKATEVYSKKDADNKFAYVVDMEAAFTVTNQNINSRVKQGDIISAINQTAEKITIDVGKLNINADTVVTWLTAKGINADLITIKNSKITINKDGVDVSMADFLYQDERGLRTTVLSKRNLVIDHDFSSTPKKVMVGNTSYSQFEMGKFWRPNGNVVIENNTYNFDYERMVNATRVDMFNYPEITVKNGIHPGNVYTLSAHFRCATINGKRVTARPQLHVCYVTYRDNVHYDIWYESKLSFDAPSTFYGDIQRRAFTFTVPTNYKPGEHAIVIKVESADGDISKGTAVCASGVQLVTGKYPSMYEWQAQSAEIYSGMMPIDSLEFGNDHGFISVAQDRQTFDFGGKLDAKFHNNIRAVQGVNLGGNAFQGWGHIRFVDGNRGVGFYVNNANGWQFNALG